MSIRRPNQENCASVGGEAVGPKADSASIQPGVRPASAAATMTQGGPMRKQAVTWLTPLILLSALSLLMMPAGQAPARKVATESKPAPLAQTDTPTQARLSAAYGQLPLSFEANQGQADS